MPERLVAKSYPSYGLNDRLVHSLAGASGGLAAAVIVCPLDIVKLRLQNQGRPSPGMPLKYNGLWSSLALIYKEEGIVKGWYRGLRATTAAYIIDRSLWFPTYHSMKSVMATQMDLSPTDSLVHLNASVIASVVCLFATNPLWVVRTRIMTLSSLQDTSSTSISSQLYKMFKNEGMGAWFVGLAPSIVGISHVAVQFPLYEKLKTLLRDRSEDKETLNNLHLLLASSISKMFASVVTYPHEVIRTRMYTAKSSKHSHDIVIKEKYRTMGAAIKTVWVEEGYKGMYKGLGTNLVRTVPSTAISLWIYEWIVHHLSH